MHLTPNMYTIMRLKTNAKEIVTLKWFWCQIYTKIINVKANAHEVHNNERPTKGSGHGKMIDPRRNSTYKRPFTQEGNYLVATCSPMAGVYI